MESSFTRLKSIIGNHLGIDPSTIKLYDRFEEDLGADSLDVIEMIILIEQEFMFNNFTHKIFHSTEAARSWLKFNVLV